MNKKQGTGMKYRKILIQKNQIKGGLSYKMKCPRKVPYRPIVRKGC